MYDAPTHAETAADVPALECARGCARCSADGRAERMGRDVRQLDHLADVGMEMALEVRRRLYALSDPHEDDKGAGVGELSLSFTRVARAVRQSVALKDRIDEARQARLDGEQAMREAALGTAGEGKDARAASGFERKNEIYERIADAIEDDAYDADDADAEHETERLFEALYERLEDPDDEADFADRPMGELMARICRDLDYTPDWSNWELEDWAIEEAERRTPGSPYANSTGRRRLTPPEEKAAAVAGADDGRGPGP